METCQGPKSRQIGGGSCADEGTRVDCRLGSAPRIHAHGIGANDAQGGDGEQCVAPAARLRGDVARSEIGTPRSADPAAGVRRLRLRCALLRNRQGRVHALSRPHALSCRDRSRILWRDRGCGKGSPGSAARRHGHLRGDDLVGDCTPCRNGYPNQCERLEEIGFTINGAQADLIAVAAKSCWKINALADRYGSVEWAYEAGALCEPTSVAYNAMFTRAGGFRPGGHVTVFGTGPIGFAAIALARAAGAAKIIAFEVSPMRAELAKKVGADVVLNP